MVSDVIKSLITDGSIIRAMFEEGNRLSAIYGKENVYNFSLGNPNVDPPVELNQMIEEILLKEEPNFIHGYMNNAGYEDVRDSVAKSINKEFDTDFSAKNILMTVGAAGALNVIFKTMLNPGDEVLVIAPFFGEYANYIANFGGNMVVVPPDIKEFQINMEAFKEKITEKTKAVIINSPNNPTGVVYSETTLKNLADILTEKSKDFNKPIYLISDEPYRKLVYGNIEVPYVSKFYKNTFIVYSFSKSLSLPGERIGYITSPSEMEGFEEIAAGLSIANRILGFVNAPSLMQRLIARCIDTTVDVSIYEKNRNILYNKLLDLGFECINPDGAFYLFPKALEVDDVKFCEEAKKFNLLMVSGSFFGCPGFFRISYCVSQATCENSLDKFEALAKLYKK